MDILVIKRDTEIETDIYFKPTDSKQYLLFTSCHPKHTRTNIPFNLARRICTIVSNLETRNNRLTELQEILIERKYPRTLIDNGIARAKAIDIQELRRPKDTLDTVNVLPYVSTHNPRNAEAYNIIHQNMPLLQKDQRMKRALQTQKLSKVKDSQNH